MFDRVQNTLLFTQFFVTSRYFSYTLDDLISFCKNVLKIDTSQLEAANGMKSQNEVSADQTKACPKLTRKTPRQCMIRIRPTETLGQDILFVFKAVNKSLKCEMCTDISQSLGI